MSANVKELNDKDFAQAIGSGVVLVINGAIAAHFLRRPAPSAT